MRLTGNPWNDDIASRGRALQREMSQLLEGAGPRSREFPAMNMWADAAEAVVTAQIPGVDPSEIGLTVQENILTVESERDPGGTPEDASYHRRERVRGRFTRSIRLPFDVQIDKVKATCRHGVLEITLPRATSSKPARISIKS